MIRNRKLALKTGFFLFILILQISEYALFELSSAFKPLDEIIAVTALGYVYLKITTYGIVFTRQEKRIVACYLGICLFGLFSNFMFEYQKPVTVLRDLLVFIKPVCGYFLARALLLDINLEVIIKKVTAFCRVVSVVLLFLIIMNYVLKIFPFCDIRYNIPSQELFFGHPTYLASTCMAIIVLLTGTMKDKDNLPYICLCMLTAVSSLRMKVIVAVLICAGMILFAVKGTKPNKTVIVVSLLSSILISYQQLNYYYIENADFARSVLTRTSIKIAGDHFPLGSGFATFASYESGVSYSPVYSKYRINRIHGLTVRRPNFVSDTFWPMLLGQFGFFGLLLFLVMLATLLAMINQLTRLSYTYYYSALSALVYLLVTSTSESSFVQPYAVLMFYIIGMFTSQLSIKAEDASILCESYAEVITPDKTCISI